MINRLYRFILKFKWLDQAIFKITKLISIYIYKDISAIWKSVSKRNGPHILAVIYWIFKVKSYSSKIPKYNVLSGISDKQALKEFEEISGKYLEKIENFYVRKVYETSRSYCGEVTNEIKEIINKQISQEIEHYFKSNTRQKKDFDVNLALEALELMISIAQKNNYKLFPISGTLLGLHRHNSLLPNDYDIDLGYFSAQTPLTEILESFQKVSELKIIKVSNCKNLVVLKYKNIDIDIFNHYLEDDQIIHSSDLQKWSNTPFSLKKKNYNGLECYVPSDIPLYLKENYGNWSNRVLFWNFTYDTPNREYIKNVNNIFYLTTHIIEGLKQKNRFKTEQAILALDEYYNLDFKKYITINDKFPYKENKTVITFGTYDLFHIGHLNILRRAQAYGDRLVVGVSSDNLNFSKKNSYPTYCEKDRLDIVKSISGVSEVFLEESLELKRHYIQQHNADILIMGDDWAGKFDEFNDICEVIYLSRTENISTTSTKENIISSGFESNNNGKG